MFRRLPSLVLACALSSFFCSRREEIGSSWLIEQPRTLLIDSGQPPRTLYLRTSKGKRRVDKLILSWRDYGRCIVYVTARSGNSTFVFCDDRAPALVGIDWDTMDYGLSREVNGTQNVLSTSALLELTKDRPALTEDWAQTMTEADELRMLEKVELLSQKRPLATSVSDGRPTPDATVP